MNQRRDFNPLKTTDLNLLFVLHALMRTHSTTAAASMVGRTQSAVSMSLGRLRDIFGDPLFVRSGQGLEPTPLAIQLQAPLERLLFDANRLLEIGEQFDPRTTQRHFKIAFTEYATRQTLTLHDRLCAQAPKAKFALTSVSLREADYDWGEKALRSGTIDLLVSFYRSDVPHGLHIDQLPTQQWAALGRYRENHEDLSLDDWLSRPHILVTSGQEGRSPISDALAALGLKRKIGLRTNSLYQALCAASTSDMILNAMSPVVLPLARSLNLESWPAPIDLPDVSMALIARDETFDPATTWLAKEARRVFCEASE